MLKLLRDKLDISITTDIEKVAFQMKQYSYNGINIKEKYQEIFYYIEDYEYEKAIVLVEEVIRNNV